MTFEEILNQAMALLQRQGRVSYRALKRQFDLDEAYLEDVKLELIEVHQVTWDQDSTMLVWTGPAAALSSPVAAPAAGPCTSAGHSAAGLHAAPSQRQDPLLAPGPGGRTQTGHGAVCRPRGLQPNSSGVSIPKPPSRSWIPPSTP